MKYRKAVLKASLIAINTYIKKRDLKKQPNITSPDPEKREEAIPKVIRRRKQ